MTKLRKQYVIDVKGRKVSVILPLEEYERLMEDLHDLAVLAKRRGEPNIALDEMKQRLKNDEVNNG